MNDRLLSLNPLTYPQWNTSELLNVLDQTSKGHLIFKRSPTSKTYISHQYLEHPFHITRPFYLDSSYPELATLYLQSSSGGIVQGDWLQLNLDLEPGAAVQFTTQAGTKVHTMEQELALQKTLIDLKSGAYLEYVPEPLILFPHSRLIASTVIQIAADAELIFSDSFTVHTPYTTKKSNQINTFDLFANELIIMQNDKILVLDRFSINNLQPSNITTSIFDYYKAQGTVFLISQKQKPTELVSTLRDRIPDLKNSYIGISTLPNNSGAWVRILASDTHTLRTALEATWAASRTALTNTAWSKRKK